MTMNESKHSPGLCALTGVNDPPNQGNLTLDIGDICGAATMHTHCEEHWPRETQVANGRLLAAAFNSYNRHCGPRAVECAEGDLLGELLEALQKAVGRMEAVARSIPVENRAPGVSQANHVRHMAGHLAEHAKIARAAIAAATGEYLQPVA